MKDTILIALALLPLALTLILTKKKEPPTLTQKVEVDPTILKKSKRKQPRSKTYSPFEE